MWEGKGKVNPKGLLPPRASQPLPPWYQASGPRCGQLPTFEEAGRCSLCSEDAAVTAGYSGAGRGRASGIGFRSQERASFVFRWSQPANCIGPAWGRNRNRTWSLGVRGRAGLDLSASPWLFTLGFSSSPPLRLPLASGPRPHQWSPPNHQVHVLEGCLTPVAAQKRCF